MENLGLFRGDLKLCEYDSNYTEIFNKLKAELEEVLKGQYVSIEHVGSTSIKGIVSKPIIDVLVTVEDLEAFKQYAIEHVQSERFTLKLNGVNTDDFLIRVEEGEYVKAFVHCSPVNSEEAIGQILFRDYMNNHKEAALAYEKLKLDLIDKYPNDRPKYTESKNDFIKDIIQKAKKEKGI